MQHGRKLPIGSLLTPLVRNAGGGGGGGLADAVFRRFGYFANNGARRGFLSNDVPRDPYKQVRRERTSGTAAGMLAGG